ncbi:dihydrolipoyllysine-residue acetyltransferase [Moniliophthora roreri MCA 2997]|uniref:Dihydrolipoyllysine-residue acetyltransferase n=2 Tax=Moniliophthora roreri TaxID=221103 RepID=V2Y9C4_MONRO|nr:dihydrolipoyllysine-residue acetyltransferase [Moniliophthora roreri MCA 2997]KAI3615929.1 dihydrolipoyllysine-residue acetyltransferase [Moniliophthora roreri]
MASTIVLNSITRAARSGGSGHVRRRSFHASSAAQAILMPAMSPLMTEGTITQWKKKEGEAFSAGDVLLQIESDFVCLDVRAELPGVIGKILSPDGSTNVPVEQVIALVARDKEEFARSQFVPTPTAPRVVPRRVPTPPTTPTSGAFPRSHLEHSQSGLLQSMSHRSFDLAFVAAHEATTNGVASARGMATERRQNSAETRPRVRIPACMVPLTPPTGEQGRNDPQPGVELRRAIVANMSRSSGSEEAGRMAYFNGLMH